MPNLNGLDQIVKICIKRFDLNQEDIYCERNIKVKELVCDKTGRLNKWFNMFRDFDN
jgi:hypothetical protein